MNQQIRFCAGFDGARLAYTVTGKGAPLVKAVHWLTHLEFEWQNPVWKPWIERLSASHTLLRMDARGCGLSDWEVPEITFEAMVRDFSDIIDSAGMERFALFGHSQGGAIAVEYAARNPQRVTHLVLLGAFARGAMLRDPTPDRIEELQALLKLIQVGWGRDDPLYRQMMSLQFMPGATTEQILSLSELQRVSTTSRNAVRIVEALQTVDVREAARKVRCPTLLMHARGDRRIPYHESLLLASLIPGARFVPLESENHILMPQEPAWQQFFAELEAFVPRAAGTRNVAQFASLTPREAEVLERIAQGLDNAQIAAHLELSEKTVRNHITRIFDKLGVESRAQTIVLARNGGFGQR